MTRREHADWAARHRCCLVRACGRSGYPWCDAYHKNAYTGSEIKERYYLRLHSGLCVYCGLPAQRERVIFCEDHAGQHMGLIYARTRVPQVVARYKQFGLPSETRPWENEVYNKVLAGL